MGYSGIYCHVAWGLQLHMKIIETCVVLLGIAMSESKIEHEIKSQNEMQNNCCSKFSIITIKVLSDPETVEFTTKI